MKRIKIIAVIVLTGALIGLINTIERTARPITERQPGQAAPAADEHDHAHDH
jgi:hypothetical protein